MKEPESMEECIYFTRRVLKPKGKIMAWVFKKKCSECGKLIGKPVDPKTGKVKIRAKEYVCECGFTQEKQAYEESLTCNIKYECPHCGKEGETQVPFKRKKFKGVDAIIFQCEGCGEKIPITKKMANPKK